MRGTQHQLFSPDLEGEFVRRPNRFVIIADTGIGQVEAHCPNPGRMQEILFPGTRIFLEKSGSSSRVTDYTFVAAEHNGELIALHSSRTNTIARELVLPGLFDNTKAVRSEVTFGRSRFDFSVETDEGTILVEVKSCTLCELGVAMFPDAPSSRGQRHLLEMAELVSQKK